MNGIFKLTEAANYLGISYNTLRRHMKRKDNPIPVLRIGQRNLFTTAKLLDGWLEAEGERMRRERENARRQEL